MTPEEILEPNGGKPSLEEAENSKKKPLTPNQKKNRIIELSVAAAVLAVAAVMTTLIPISIASRNHLTIKENGISYRRTGDRTVSLTQIDNSVKGDVVVPSHVSSRFGTFEVTSVGNNDLYYTSIFKENSKIISLSLPETVTTIGEDAFRDCSSLTSITIPSSVTSIEHGTFYGCSSLTSITIPSSVTSIGQEAFDRCTSLASIVIPSSVTAIGFYAFYGCSSLTDIYCEAASKPSGWDSSWKGCSATVHWGYTGS